MRERGDDTSVLIITKITGINTEAERRQPLKFHIHYAESVLVQIPTCAMINAFFSTIMVGFNLKALL